VNVQVESSTNLDEELRVSTLPLRNNKKLRCNMKTSPSDQYLPARKSSESGVPLLRAERGRHAKSHIDTRVQKESVRQFLSAYLSRFSSLAGPLVTCGPVLSWLEVDNRGNRLIITDDSDINTPAVAAAYAVKRYSKQAQDEISFEVGDMISVIDMPPPEESIWWRGKRGFEVGFFPCECVEVIGDKVPHGLNLPGHAHNSQTLPHLARRDSTQSDSPSEPTKPVLRKHGKLITFFRSFILSRPTRGKLKKSGILKERVFGCDLGEHLLNTGQEVPKVLRHCSSFIEARGIVDGIYRLSGISSNIQRLRVAFDEDRLPDLFEDRLVLQDIHSVSSLLKMYFRELPNPVCTFHLYEKFVEAARSSDDIRLPKLRDVVSQLPPPNYRTLEYLTKHLHRVSLRHGDTGMTAKNVAIVWAPNLLRCKSLEVGGVAALQGVGVQAVVTEYLIKYCELIFSDKLPQYSMLNTDQNTPRTIAKCRPKSLAISTPTKLLTLEEARNRALTACNNIENQKYIEVGGGPENLPAKYHTVIELPGKKGGSFKHKKSTAWKSIFSGKEKKKSTSSDRKSSTPSELNLLSASQGTVPTPRDYMPATVKQTLRPVRSAESLVPQGQSDRNSKEIPTPSAGHTPHTPVSVYSGDLDVLGPLETVTSAVNDNRKDSPKCHSRSSSHDSYFERKLSVQFKIDDMDDPMDQGEKEVSPHMKLDSSLDISEIQVNFDLEDNEMKIFSEDEAMMSTSVGSELSLPRSPFDETPCTPMPKASSPAVGVIIRGSNQRNEDNLDSPTKARRMSFKEKFKKFTSPTMSRKQSDLNKMVDSGVGFDSDSYSGSYENKSFDDGKKSSKLKEKIVSALSPESLRKRSDAGECSPKKKKSNVSPNASPNTGSLMKRSKIEDDDFEMSSLNLSPSIRFIDASSSYELGPGMNLSSETLRDGRQSITPRPDDHWNEGAETVRELNIDTEQTSGVENDPDSEQDKEGSINDRLVEAQVHHMPIMRDESLDDFVGPISIIGATLDVEEEEVEKESIKSDSESTFGVSKVSSSNQHSSAHTPGTETLFNDDFASINSQTSDDIPLKLSTKEDSSSRSDTSVSLAGATVSENESFGLDLTNDEQTGNDDETETIGQMETKTALQQELVYASSSQADSSSESEYETEEVKYTTLTQEDNFFALNALKTADNSAYSIHVTAEKCFMDIDEDKKLNFNKQTEDDVAEIDCQPLIHEGLLDDAYSIETDLSIVSAEIPENKKLYERYENRTVIGDMQSHKFCFDAGSAATDSSESPGESNTSERSESRTSRNSDQPSVQSSPSDVEPLLEPYSPEVMSMMDGPKSLVSENTSSGIETQQTQSLSLSICSPFLPETDSAIQSEISSDATLKVVSPQMESVIMRKSPSSPARNRSVRSDFLTNLVGPTVEQHVQPLKLDIPTNDIGRPPLPKTSPPKFTGIAKALSPQPYNKPPAYDAQNKMMKNKYSRHSSERISFSAERSQRDSPSPKLAKIERAASVEPTPSLIITEIEPVESSNYNLNKSCVAELYPKDTSISTLQNHNESNNEPCQFDLDSSTEPELSSSMISEQAALESVTQSLRNQSLSPVIMESAEVEAEQDCHSLPIEEPDQEMALPQLEDGRRSTQGIPEVERNVKFSNPDVRSFKKKRDRRTDSPVRKNRCKSSTLSLHTVAASPEEEDEPPLQRRNSIHNVPFVDVNDPETRTRMERYKEERRSMLRAKYKAEDYLSTSFTRKKKLSTTSSQDSTESDQTQKYSKSVSPPVSPEILDTRSPPVYRKHPVTKPVEYIHIEPVAKVLPERSPNPNSNPFKILESLNVSRKLVDLKQPEHTFVSRKSLPDNFDKIQDTINDKTELKKKWSIGSNKSDIIIPTSSFRQRPAELSFSKSTPVQSKVLDSNEMNNKNIFKANPVEVVTENKVNSAGQIEDNVNVRERASIFGPRKVSESKVRMVSAHPDKIAHDSAKQQKFSGGINPTSPSKIKNMAAMFEQKH